MLIAAASAIGRSNFTDAAQWMTCVTSSRMRTDSALEIPRPGSVTSPATGMHIDCQPGSEREKHGEVATF
jgi:hypothetical protein